MDRQCSSCGGFCKQSGCERETEFNPDWGAKELSEAYELLQQCEVEMRYAGWANEVGDNYGRFRVYSAVLNFLHPPEKSK